MKTKNLKNIFVGIFALTFLVLTLTLVSAGQTWFYFESNTSASTLTVPLGIQVPFTAIASSNNYVPVSQQKIEAIPGGTLVTWPNSPGTQYGSTYLWSATNWYLNTNTLGQGTFTIKFSAQTNTGVQSSTLTLIVNPADTTAPVITMLGNSPITINVGSNYTDAGATAWDNVDGDLTANIITVNNVNTAVAGTYTVTYDVMDSSGNWAIQVVRTVIVSADTTAPVITMLGTSPVNVSQYSTYTDAGATAWDNVDGDITANIITVNNVNTSVIGTYTVTYDVQDSSGNPAVQVVRIVNVVAADTTAPVITALSPTNNQVMNDTSIVLEVSVNEAVSNVTYSLNGGPDVLMTSTGPLIFKSSTLNLNDDQSYNVTYKATDLSGNVGTLTITFSINEDDSSSDDNDDFDSDADFSATNQTTSLTEEETINLTDETCKLNWWKRFINWLSRLFGLEEVYSC